MADNSTKANNVAKILFIVGGILLFVILAIFIVRLVPVAISNISNFASNIGTNIRSAISDEDIVVTTDSDSLTHGSPVVVNFEYAPEVPGQFYVSYSCADGLFFDIQSNNGPKRIICETPFKLGENLSAISLIPVVTKENTFMDSTITVEFKDAQNNTVAKGTRVVTVRNESAEGTTATSTPENPYSANTGANGSSGAEVTSTPAPAQTSSTGTTGSTGATRTYTSTYVPAYVPAGKDLVITDIRKIGNDSAFTFTVYNFGGTPTGAWYFSYTDAQNPSRTLVSPVQGSLGANQGMAVTVRFDGQKNSNQTISVHVDSYDYVSETNESNNRASVVITGPRSTGGSHGDGSYDDDDDADLVITSLEVGRLSGSRFVEEDEIDEDDTAAVRFFVKNQGGESTGSWRFEIDGLPYDDDDTYRSKSYSSLKPGQSLEVIADFDGIDEGRYTIRVEVDSDDDVDEESERNNDESETLRVER